MTAALLCIGEPMLEFNEQPGGQYLRTFGGDVSNAAIAAARQGAAVRILTRLGDDPGGEAFRALWRDEGVDAALVPTDPDNPTATYVVSHGPDGHRFHYHRRGSAASHLAVRDVPDDAVRGAAMLYASGISQAISASAADAVFHAIAVARASGVGVAYDTNYRARLWPPARAAAVMHAAMAQATVALPGFEDARMLTGLTDPADVLRFYRSLGPSVVALKMGADGVLLADGDAVVHLPPVPCDPVDATGAGDTFNGAFLTRLLRGDPPPAAARYAACAAAISTEGYGAVPPIPHAADVQDRLPR